MKVKDYLNQYRSEAIANFPDETLQAKYLSWAVPRDGRRSRQEAQRRLGKQAFCWTGWVRHWIWEGRGLERGMWRLFGSRKGLSLELVGCGIPWDDSVDLDLAHALLDDFIAKWQAGGE